MFTGVLAMDYEFILRVAERRIKAAMGKVDPGKTHFTQLCASVLRERRAG